MFIVGFDFAYFQNAHAGWGYAILKYGANFKNWRTISKSKHNFEIFQIALCNFDIAQIYKLPKHNPHKESTRFIFRFVESSMVGDILRVTICMDMRSIREVYSYVTISLRGEVI